MLSIAAEAPSPKDELQVMSYNLRFASTNRPNAWPDRRPLMRELVQSASPDIIGTQEGLFGQLNDMAVDLPDYTWIGVGRDDGREKGEFMAVFYRKSRLQPLSTNYFWLSDTPEVPGSTTWGNKNRRMVTTLKFHDRAANKDFYLLDTHFDHEVQIAREKSAELVRKRVEGLGTNLPILLIGDFNAAVKPGTFDHTILDDCRTEGLTPPKTHWARKIETPPYLAYPVRPGITFTYLGTRVNREARMVMKNGRPAANMFAAGEIMAGNVLGKGYAAGIGMTIGSVFGRVAGQEAAKNARN